MSEISKHNILSKLILKIYNINMKNVYNMYTGDNLSHYVIIHRVFYEYLLFKCIYYILYFSF